MAVKDKEAEISSNTDERSKALKLAIEKIEKDFVDIFGGSDIIGT